MDDGLAHGIAWEVRELVTAAGRRRRLPTTLSVGQPRGERVVVPDSRGHDAGMRADLVERALDGLETTDGACAWLCRSGSPEPMDAEVQWYAAALTGFARHGLPLEAFFLVHRYGWVDLVGGSSRTWSRVRPRRRGQT